MKKQELIDFGKKIEQLYSKANIKAPVHLSGNNETQLIEIFKKIKKEDWVFSSYRSHYHALLHGISPEKLEEKIIHGHSMHIMNKDPKFYTSSIVAGHLPIALGAAMALKMKKSKNKVWAFCGDMAAETGVFHEVVKYSVGHDIPINFVIEDNNLAVYTPTREVWGKKSRPLYGISEINNKASNNQKILRYEYKRKWPHHGIGLWIEFPEDKKFRGKNFKYKEEIKKAMEILGKDKRTIFIGQTVKYEGSPIYKSLEGIPEDKKIELPVIEEVQMGIALGLGLEGYVPVSLYPRFDFLVLATNQLVNHIDKTAKLSEGLFEPNVIVRTLVGSKSPLNPGPQHYQDHTEAYKLMLPNTDVYKLGKIEKIVPTYTKALKKNKPSLIVELSDIYLKNEK